jgi:Zn-dependent protease with chaperone function
MTLAAEPATQVVPRAVRVERWPTETPLLVAVALASAFLWLLLALTILGLVYVGVICLFLFLGHVVLITHIRGNAIRLGPDQLPDLHRRVLELAAAAGVDPVPEAYVMEAGGSLNAFATRFLRSRMIVLHTDLLEACGDDDVARDMVIGHELGHIKSGHLRFIWLLAPGLLLPFLGSAYSRAREYSCDRWGGALCGDGDGAVRGLAILAAGGRLASQVNLRSFVQQTTQLDTGWMTLGKWLSRYPPLCDRIAALQPALGSDLAPSARGPIRAVALLASIVIVPVVVLAGAFAVFSLGAAAIGTLLPDTSSFASGLDVDEPSLDYESTPESAPVVEDVDAASAQVALDFERLLVVAGSYLAANGALPGEIYELEETWAEAFPGEDFPRDPFDGQYYGYQPVDAGTVFLLSSGADGQAQTDDDITLEQSVSGGSAVPEA